MNNNYGLGAKSGFFAGLAYGILNIFISLLVLEVQKGNIIAMLEQQLSQMPANVGITSESLFGIIRIFTIPSAIITGIIIGMIAGVIFIIIKDKLFKTKQGLFEFLIYSLIVWVAISIPALFAISGIAELISLLLGIPGMLLFGFMFYYFYKRFEKKPVIIEEKEPQEKIVKRRRKKINT